MAKAPRRFRAGAALSREQQRIEHDRRRGSASERGYTWAWAKASAGHLRNSPLCVGCLAIGRTEAAVLVDHVVPHKGDTDRFWDTSLWQSSCRWHHDVVKQRLEAMWARGEIAIVDLRLGSLVAQRLSRSLPRG